MKNKGEIILYKNQVGNIKINVRLEDDTVWLNQKQIALLFCKGRTTIVEHIGNVFKEGELDENVVCRKFRHTTQHGAIEDKTQEKDVKYYNLDVIISVGYRVKSLQGTNSNRISLSPCRCFAATFNKFKTKQKKLEKEDSFKEIEQDIKMLKKKRTKN